MPSPLVTPDGRYLVVRGRLWRTANPHLDSATRQHLVDDLMSARRAKGAAIRSGGLAAREHARQSVDRAKHALDERGPVWWTDGTPDLNRHLVKTHSMQSGTEIFHLRPFGALRKDFIALSRC